MQWLLTSLNLLTVGFCIEIDALASMEQESSTCLCTDKPFIDELIHQGFCYSLEITEPIRVQKLRESLISQGLLHGESQPIAQCGDCDLTK